MMTRVFLSLGLLVTCASPIRGADRISFRNDVMPVLAKAGCNMGTCHGNLNGKGGFKLTLRGDDPAIDYRTLTRGAGNRRVNLAEPADSLLILKSTMQVAHEGGRRFNPDSIEYDILKRWIEQGIPDDGNDLPVIRGLNVSTTNAVMTDPADSLQLTVEAEFSNGIRRDVTQLAVYEPADEAVASVTHDGLIERVGMGETSVGVRFLNQQQAVRIAFIPAREEFTWQAERPKNRLDEAVYTKLQSLRMNPSPRVDDGIFVRRLYLDLIGRTPSRTEAHAFLDNQDPNKRAALIDALLKHPEFAGFWAQKWADLLRIEEKVLDRKGVQAFFAWIRQSIADDKPLNRFAAELIAARGSTYSNPPANYYRAMRTPDMRAESAAQVMLGVRLQCAKCHNHPFDRWTQDDYYGWTNLFARVDYKILSNDRRDRNDKHEFDGEQIVFIKSDGEVNHPNTGKPVPPRFLGDAQLDPESSLDRLEQLALWIGDPSNRRFAEMQANRIWFQVFGQGIVDPIDDFRATNPPANPELLTVLTDSLVDHGFRLRPVLQMILNSNTYQTSVVANESNANDDRNFARTKVRRLSSEQLADSLSTALDLPIGYNGYPVGTRAAELAGVRPFRRRDQGEQPGDQFLKLFGKPPRLTACECERVAEPTLDQTFQMISGPLVNELLKHQENRLTKLLGEKISDPQRVRRLYWATLSREPSEAELVAGVQLLDTNDNRRERFEDLAWALINSNEFLFRQ